MSVVEDNATEAADRLTELDPRMIRSPDGRPIMTAPCAVLDPETSMIWVVLFVLVVEEEEGASNVQ